MRVWQVEITLSFIRLRPCGRGGAFFKAFWFSTKFVKFSFVYSYSNYFVQFSSNDYRVISKNNNDLGIDAVNGIVIIEQGKYLIMTNNSYGLTIVQPFYS